MTGSDAHMIVIMFAVLATLVVGGNLACNPAGDSAPPPPRSTSSEAADTEPAGQGAAREPWPPADLGRADIVSDDALVLDRSGREHVRETSPADVRQALSGYQAVEKTRWLREYHHVAGQDQAGWLVLPDGTRLKWVLRPGGLAYVQYPDGTTIFLARRGPEK